jgi:RHS repeat-associated protein
LLSRTTSGGTTSWYLADRLGTIRDIANTSGSLIDHVSYEAFGTILTESSPSDGDRFKFTAREWDAAVQLQANRARQLSLSTGRWTSRDPIGFDSGDSNHFRYVFNNSISNLDPLGLLPWFGPFAGKMEVMAGTTVRPGLQIGYIPEGETAINGRFDIFPFPQPGETVTMNVDAIVVLGPTGGVFKVEGGFKVQIWTGPDGTFHIDTIDEPWWPFMKDLHGWYPAGTINPFKINVLTATFTPPPPPIRSFPPLRPWYGWVPGYR